MEASSIKIVFGLYFSANLIAASFRPGIFKPPSHQIHKIEFLVIGSQVVHTEKSFCAPFFTAVSQL